MTNIIIYSKPGCGRCIMTKKGLQRKSNVKIKEEMVNDKLLHQFSEQGFSSLPVVVVNPDTPEEYCWSGLDMAKIQEV